MSKYLLVFHNTHKKLRLNVENKRYLVYVNSLNEVFDKTYNDFKLKEKLYILNYPLDVVWIPISDTYFDILKIFNNMITPQQIKINVVNGKVFPKILRYCIN